MGGGGENEVGRWSLRLASGHGWVRREETAELVERLVGRILGPGCSCHRYGEIEICNNGGGECSTGLWGTDGGKEGLGVEGELDEGREGWTLRTRWSASETTTGSDDTVVEKKAERD